MDNKADLETALLGGRRHRVHPADAESRRPHNPIRLAEEARRVEEEAKRAAEDAKQVQELARAQELARQAVDPERHAAQAAAASAERDRLLGTKKGKYGTLRARSDVLREREAKTVTAKQFEMPPAQTPQPDDGPTNQTPLSEEALRAGRAERDWYASINCDVEPTEMEMRDRHMSAKKDKYGARSQTAPGANMKDVADNDPRPGETASGGDTGIATHAARAFADVADAGGCVPACAGGTVDEQAQLLHLRDQSYGTGSPALSAADAMPSSTAEAAVALATDPSGPLAAVPKVGSVAPTACPMNERDALLSQKRSKYGAARVRVR